MTQREAESIFSRSPYERGFEYVCLCGWVCGVGVCVVYECLSICVCFVCIVCVDQM